VGFLPAISDKAAKAIRATIRDWRLASTRNNQSLERLARLINAAARGRMNYCGRHYRLKCELALCHVNLALAAWGDGNTRCPCGKAPWRIYFSYLRRLAVRTRANNGGDGERAPNITIKIKRRFFRWMRSSFRSRITTG
jgi:hypothetical protein